MTHQTNEPGVKTPEPAIYGRHAQLASTLRPPDASIHVSGRREISLMKIAKEPCGTALFRGQCEF